MVISRKLKLYLSEEQEKLFEETSEKVRDCVNFWIDKIKEEEHTNLKVLQEDYYKEAREKFGLSADITQIAQHTAIRIARRRKKKRKTTPYLKKKFIGINQNNSRVNDKLEVSLGDGFMGVEFKSQELPEGEIKESKIRKEGNEWYCDLSIEIETPKQKKYKRTMGVDLGLAKIAVIADWNGNNTKFFGGSQLSKIKKHYENLRAELQEDIDKGNVYKKLKRISKKERNWVKDKNHKISREIVDIAKGNKRTIVLENLTGITERVKVNKKTRKMLNNWSFRELSDFIKYKAKMEGLTVITVDPRQTSKRCSNCGYTSRYNRKSQERFKCKECGYETNADRNAAINIAQRGREVMA